MSSVKTYVCGAAIAIFGVRLAVALIRANAPPAWAAHPADPDAISQRETRKGEARAATAALLGTSEIDLADREKLDEARGDAGRSLRDLAGAANAAGARAVGTEALALDVSLLRDARRACSLDALKQLDAASSALTPSVRAPLAERLAIVHRHVTRTCELATR